MNKLQAIAISVVSIAVVLIFAIMFFTIIKVSASNNERLLKIQTACIEHGGSFANGTCLYGAN